MADTPRLDLPREWTGHWWLPNDPERLVPGILSYDPHSGLRLSLIGGFEDKILRPIEYGFAVMEAAGPGS